MTIIITRPAGGSTQLPPVNTATGTGIYTVTGPTTAELRTIVGTANQVTVVNGDGVAGNPTLSISSNPILPGTGSVTIPIGTNAQRPGSPVNGMIRYNTTTALFEFYQNGSWVNLGTGSGGVTQIIAGTNITISPLSGLGVVTINAASSSGTLHLYNESFLANVPNVVTGTNSFAIGEDNHSTGTNSFTLGVSNYATNVASAAIGNSAVANFPGQLAHAAGKFATVGDAQGSDYIYRIQTSTQFPIQAFLDGVSSQLVLSNSSAIAFEALAVARRTDFLPATSGHQTATYVVALTGATPIIQPSAAYTANVTIDGNPIPVSIDLSTTPTVGAFLTALNAQLGAFGGSSLVGGNVQVTSSTTGVTSTVSIADGIISPLFASLPGFSAFLAPVNGTNLSYTGGYAAFRLEGLIKRDATAGSTAIVGVVNKNIITRTNTNLDVIISADTGSGALKVMVQGVTGQNYNWVVRLISVEEIG